MYGMWIRASLATMTNRHIAFHPRSSTCTPAEALQLSQMEFLAQSRARHERERAAERARLESITLAPKRLTDEEAARKEEEDLQGR